ncbi:SprT family zinc-dependent metalloprotease [soil metagenome]
MSSNALQKPSSSQSNPLALDNLQTVEYGTTTIQFNLTYSNRRTLEIAVYPDQTVWVTAPESSEIEKVFNKVRKRGRWIVKQLRYFNRFDTLDEHEEYVSGETHRYLGRQYRLKVMQVERGESESVKLKKGYFHIWSNQKGSRVYVKAQLADWYRQKAERKFMERLDVCLQAVQKYDVSRPELQLYSMEKRWGSYTPSGKVLLNPELIKHPVYCIDYVIIHELCHTKHPNHDKEFYRLLNQVLPDWQKRKHKLERFR